MIDRDRGLLAIAAIGISSVALYSLINPEVGNHSVSTFTFPPQIPLADWEYQGKHNIEVDKFNSKDSQDVVQSAIRYRYKENDTPLNIDIYYLTDTRGHLESLLSKRLEIDSESLQTQKIEQQANGYYSLFSDRDRTYLSSCLNPTGKSTVTQKQFSQNLNQRPLDLELLKNWLLGKASIRDRRCLWVTISTPQNSGSFLQSSDILEQVWQTWYEWWQPRFPSL